MSVKYLLILVSSLILISVYINEYSFVIAQGLSWDIGESMPTNRTEITSERIDNKIYVLGGADYLKDGIMDLVEVYDPNLINGVKPLQYLFPLTIQQLLYIMVNYIL